MADYTDDELLSLLDEDDSLLDELMGYGGAEVEPERNSWIGSDLLTAAKEGAFQIGADLTGAVGLDSWEESLQASADEARSEYTEETVAAQEEFGLGEDETLFNRAGLVEIFKQAGQLPAFLIPGGAAAKGTYLAARGLGALKGARAAIKAADAAGDATALAAATQKMAQADKLLNGTAGAAGYGSVNALVIGEGSADEVEDLLSNRTKAEWFSQPGFKEKYTDAIRNGSSTTEAFDVVIQSEIIDARDEAETKGRLLGSATGAVAGPLASKALTGGVQGGVAKSAFSGLATEAPSEFLEEAGQASVVQDIVPEADIDIMERGAMGAILGGVAGGGLGAVGGTISAGRMKREEAAADLAAQEEASRLLDESNAELDEVAGEYQRPAGAGVAPNNAEGYPGSKPFEPTPEAVMPNENRPEGAGIAPNNAVGYPGSAPISPEVESNIPNQNRPPLAGVAPNNAVGYPSSSPEVGRKKTSITQEGMETATPEMRDSAVNTAAEYEAAKAERKTTPKSKTPKKDRAKKATQTAAEIKAKQKVARAKRKMRGAEAKMQQESSTEAFEKVEESIEDVAVAEAELDKLQANVEAEAEQEASDMDLFNKAMPVTEKEAEVEDVVVEPTVDTKPLKEPEPAPKPVIEEKAEKRVEPIIEAKVEEQVEEQVEAKVEEAVEAAPEQTAEEATQTIKETLEGIAKGDIDMTDYVDGVQVQHIPEGVTSKTSKKGAAPKKKAKPKKQRTFTADALERLIAKGRIDYNTAMKSASPEGVEAGVMTQEEADIFNEMNEAPPEIGRDERLNQQLNGFINTFGIESKEYEWAQDKLESHPNFNDLAEVAGFRRTVKNLMMADEDVATEAPVEEDATVEADSIPEDRMTGNVAPDEQAMPTWAAKSPPANTKASIEQEFLDRFDDRLPRNVEIFDTYDDIPNERKNKGVADAAAFYNPTTKKVYMVADKIRKGKALNTLFHEKSHQLLQSSPEWQDVLINTKLLLARKDPQVTQAYNTAVRNVPEDRLKRDPDAIDKETVAYLLTHAPEASISKRIIRKLKEMMRKLTGYEMSANDIIDMVVQKAEQDVESDVEVMAREYGLETNAEMEAEVNLETDISFTDAYSESEVSMLKDNVITAGDSASTVTMMRDPALAIGDLAYKALDAVQELGQKAKNISLALMPNRPMLDMIDRMLPEGIKVSGIQDILDRQMAAANQKMEYLTETVLKPFQNYQHNNTEEYNKLVKIMLNATNNNVDAEGSAELRTLSQEGQDLYVEVRDHFKQMATDKVESMRIYVDTLDIDSAKKRDMMATISQLNSHLDGQKVYFPFNRWGKYRVEGEVASQRYVAFHETLAAANREISQKKNQGVDLTVSRVKTSLEQGEAAMSSEAYEAAVRFIDQMGGNQAAKDAMWETFMKFSPQSALQKRMARRQGVAGMSEDMVRGLNQSINRDVRQNERIKAQPKINKIMSDVTKAVEEVQGDTVKIDAAMNELRKRHLYNDPRAGWSKEISKVNFFYYLGFNPASAMINLTQNAIVGVPVLGADHGFTRTVVEMNKQFAHVAKSIVLGDLNNMGYEGIERKAYQALKANQAIDVTQAHMMAGLNDGPSDGYTGAGDKFMQASAFMFHRAEVANRATTAMTAFNMQYAKTQDFEASVKYAKDKTYEAQFDFSEEGKSRAQQSDLGNVFLALKSYPINMAVYMGRNFNKAVGLDKNATTEEKRVAKAQLFGTMGITMLLGGTGALPFTDILPEIFFTLFGDDGDDPYLIMKEGLTSLTNETMADVVMEGLVGTVLDVDMQSKVSLGLDMFARVQGGQSAEDRWEAVKEGAMGPAFNIISQASKGIDQMNEGKVAEGMATILPTEVKNLLKSSFAAQSGIRQTAYDTKIEDASAMDVFKKALGFNSAEYADYFRTTSGERRGEMSAKSNKKRLLRDLAVATSMGSAKERREARRAIRDYNRSANRDDIISQSSIRRSLSAYKDKIMGVQR